MTKWASTCMSVGALALAACSLSEDAPNPEATATLSVLPVSSAVDFSEAERILGMQLVFPDYVPRGLVLDDEALLERDPKWESANVIYTLNEALTDEPVISILSLVEWTPRAEPDLRLEGDEVEVSSNVVFVDGYADSPDTHRMIATWRQDGRYFSVTAFGFDGVPPTDVRNELVMTVRSIVEQLP